jgi:hypothetical protein
MKVCPKCGEAFSDDTLRFCLTDGTELVDGSTLPTVQMPTDVSVPTAVIPRAKRKTNPFIWIVAGLVVLAIGGAVLVAIIVYAYEMGKESARTEKVQSGNTVTPQKSQPKTTAPSPTNSSPESTPSGSPATNTGDDSSLDEITPITWTTAAVGFKQETGRTYRFHCPEKGTPGAIWGSDIYTADSSICTAAVHAGVITLEQGGDVTIEFKPGRSIYGSTTRNGVTSNTYGEYPHSFVVH